MNRFLPLLFAALLLPLSPALAARDAAQKPLVQIYFGLMDVDDQTVQWSDGAGGSLDVDFASLPSFGIEAEYLFGRGWVYWGLNPGASVIWRNDDTRVAGTLTQQNGGSLWVDLDNSLLLFEAHLGGYVRGRLADRVTAYAAAGPMVMHGTLDVKNRRVVESTAPPPDTGVIIPNGDSSDINLGFYARFGVDFEINSGQHLGFGIRYLSTELDFDQTNGDLDIKGPQFVLTLSAQL